MEEGKTIEVLLQDLNKAYEQYLAGDKVRKREMEALLSSLMERVGGLP